MKVKNFPPQSFPRQNIVKFFLSLAGCLLIFGHTLFAAELQFGVSGVSMTSSEEHDGAVAVMPSIALQASLDPYRRLKVELGTLSYSMKKREQTLSEGEIGVKAYSVAGVLSTKAILTSKERQMNFNVGFGFVNYEYDNGMTPGAGDSGLARTREDIASTTGTQYILGMDFILGRSFLLTMETRYIDIKPETAIYFNDNGKEKVEVEKMDFSHFWVVLSVAYLFDF